MEYTIKQLADLSGVTSRALRWYDREVPGCAAFLEAAVLAWLGL